MAITIYKRGKFWWLTGYDAAGNRVHESTGVTGEDEAEHIRIAREKEGLDLKLLGPKATFTFDQAAVAYITAGRDRKYLAPLIVEFGHLRISEMTGTMVRAAARKLYPGAAFTTWNRQVITP